MRTSLLCATLAGVALLTASPAWTAMFKCTSADGTVQFQGKPCATGQRGAEVDVVALGSRAESPAAGQTVNETKRKAVDGRFAVRDERDIVERAAADRAITQRRDRCRSYRDAIERQLPLLEAKSDLARARVEAEIKIQERRLKEDGC